MDEESLQCASKSAWRSTFRMGEFVVCLAPDLVTMHEGERQGGSSGARAASAPALCIVMPHRSPLSCLAFPHRHGARSRTRCHAEPYPFVIPCLPVVIPGLTPPSCRVASPVMPPLIPRHAERSRSISPTDRRHGADSHSRGAGHPMPLLGSFDVAQDDGIGGQVTVKVVSMPRRRCGRPFSSGSRQTIV